MIAQRTVTARQCVTVPLIHTHIEHHVKVLTVPQGGGSGDLMTAWSVRLGSGVLARNEFVQAS
jgi:hypothetical protein